MHLLDTESRVATAAAVALAVIGVVVVLVADGVAEVIGGSLMSVGAVILVGVAFYLVGRSEDLQRSREERDRHSEELRRAHPPHR